MGILGGTGSSKTTLVQLIPRLYDATEGTVFVGGKDVRSYDLDALRSAVGIVLQKNVLFSGTVRENLRWGNAQAGDGPVGGLPDGLRRRVSGADGQGPGHGPGPGGRQRLRRSKAAAVHRPRPAEAAKILIFDDSHTPPWTHVRRKDPGALERLPNVTKIIMAQRITSVMHTDQILILEDGRVHAVGTHESLLASDPIYQEIYASQMKGGDIHGGQTA